MRFWYSGQAFVTCIHTHWQSENRELAEAVPIEKRLLTALDTPTWVY